MKLKIQSLCCMALAAASSGQVRYAILCLELDVTITVLSMIEGIPNDGTPVSHIVTVHPAITAIYDIAGVAGIILAISCGIFNFIHRKKK